MPPPQSVRPRNAADLILYIMNHNESQISNGHNYALLMIIENESQTISKCKAVWKCAFGSIKVSFYSDTLLWNYVGYSSLFPRFVIPTVSYSESLIIVRRKFVQGSLLLRSVIPIEGSILRI